MRKTNNKWTAQQIKNLIRFYFVEKRSITYISRLSGRENKDVYDILNLLEHVKSAKPDYSDLGIDGTYISPMEEKYALLKYAETAGPVIRDIIKQRLKTLNYES